MEQTTQFETFKDFDKYDIGELKWYRPSCRNGDIHITKYRITIEVVEEPDEVIMDRIRRLWKETTNSYEREELLAVAQGYGIADELEAGITQEQQSE